MILTRRKLLRAAALLPLVSLAGFVLRGCADSAPVCADPDLLSAGEKGMRDTLEYVERASDASQQCGGCRFFTVHREGHCGQCQILSGAVSSQGHCTSWVA